MPADDRLTRVAALLVLEKQPTEELHEVATEALVRGLDSPSLRELAGTPASDVRDARDLFWQAMSELDIARPTRHQAGWLLVAAWAHDIVDGRVAPYEGARRIWWEGWEELDRPAELTVFVALASEWEDHESHRDQYEHDIREAASNLLASRS
jgi:hypothetical protein